MRPLPDRVIIGPAMLTVALISLVVAQPPSLGHGRALVKSMYSGDVAAVWAEGGPGLRQQFGSAENLGGFLGKIQNDFGKELRVISEGLSTRGEAVVYRRVANHKNYARGMELELVFDDDGTLNGLTAGIASGAAPTTTGTYRSKTLLRLPVDGSWYVLWGGRSIKDNAHAAVPDQRFALDLLIFKGPTSCQGDGTRNDQYFAWSLPVRSPGEGVVVTAVDGAADNEPNRPRAGNVYGNYVVVDHGNGEFSLLAHLQRGTVQVKEGQRVQPGQLLGLTGNSGMSTEPHVHFQLMDKADWVLANGLPAQFSDYFTNGNLISKGEPKRGEVIAPASLEARRDRD